jgi:ABC-2 type transport system ATP-binding protein
MLQVDQVTRCYGRRAVLRDVAFAAAPGEIVGLLGPNGAGKTTLLRLLACYLQPTAGAIRVNGLDTFRDSLAVRRLAGYQPERCPLHDEMTVGEYLRFRARIKGLSFLRVRRRVRELTGQAGLDDVRGRLIGGLSLGCRRRVGVTDALLSDPRLLLLDDPFAGVDAEEVRRLAALIAGAGRHAVVVVSGHALAALAGLCTRFLVLRDGAVAADCHRHDLQARLGAAGVSAEIAGTSEAALRKLAARFGAAAAAVELLDDGWWRMSWSAPDADDRRDAISAEVVRHGWRLRSVQATVPALETVLADLVAGRRAAAPTREAA